MSIISNPADRNDWVAVAGALVLQLQRLETRLSIAQIPAPTQRNERLLTEADSALGDAVRAINTAQNAIRRLR